jgi:hypothetical protein
MIHQSIGGQTATFKHPGEPTVAQVLALANRLLAQKAAPGFHDIRLICEMLEQEAVKASRDYPGWDHEQIVILKVRAQVAHELITEIFNRIDAAIYSAQSLPGFQSAAEQPVTDRIPGSYI